MKHTNSVDIVLLIGLLGLLCAGLLCCAGCEGSGDDGGDEAETTEAETMMTVKQEGSGNTLTINLNRRAGYDAEAETNDTMTAQ